MSALCAILRGSLGDYASDALPAPQRKIFREHLAACEECRSRAVAEDPTMLFARAIGADEDVPELERRQILDAVRTGVALMETQRRLGRRTRRRLGSAAAAAAVAALVLLVPGTTDTASRHAPDGAALTAASQPAPSPASAASPAAADVQPAVRAADADSDAESLPPNATVYDWNPGAGREEPRVVWIVDRGLDI